MDGVPSVVSGSLAATARGWPGWTGGGSDPGEIWRVVRLSKDLSACPRSGGRVLARSGCEVVGALACQHREWIYEPVRLPGGNVADGVVFGVC